MAALGEIVTFYSYRGGVGRTMALANIAVLLARRGKRVLIIDWDLEAPGLDRYFSAFYAKPPQTGSGLLGLLESSSGSRVLIPYKRFVRAVSIPETPSFHLLAAGDSEVDYANRLVRFQWSEFFRKSHGGDFLEALRNQWKRDYDLVLIDSRSGVTESGGVSTILLPDRIIFLLVPSQQNLDGYHRITTSLPETRANLPYDRARVLILPVITSPDQGMEVHLADEWLARCAEAFRPVVGDWLPKSCSSEWLIEQTKIPRVPRYTFGEDLAVLHNESKASKSLPLAYAVLAHLIVEGFESASELPFPATRGRSGRRARESS